MTSALWKELMKLSPAKRIELAHDLWDSLAERRYQDLIDRPKEAFTWEEVKARLLARYENAAPIDGKKDPSTP